MATASTAPDYSQTVTRHLDRAECTRGLLRLLARLGLWASKAVRLRVADVDPALSTVAVPGQGGWRRTINVD